jgi:uncharacterized protein YndB with AHSA1/START domain
MATTVEAVHEYDHPVESVFEAFTDPEFYLAKFSGVGARNVEIIASGNEDGVFSVETSREVPPDVPGALKTLLGAWTTVIQNEEWIEGEEDEYLNELNIDSEGVPALLTGTMILYSSDDGCVNEVVMSIDCRIPLVGKKLERFIADSTAEQLAAEYEFIREYLEEL